MFIEFFRWKKFDRASQTIYNAISSGRGLKVNVGT